PPRHAGRCRPGCERRAAGLGAPGRRDLKLQENYMHLGVIGSGRIGVMHAVNAAKHPGVTKVTLAARNVQRLEEAAQWVRDEISDLNTTVATATDVAELLAQVTGVVIATSTPTHPPLVRQAVAA